MKKYIINGSKPLSGSITIPGSKNVAVKAVIAACLTDEEVVIENIPHISDVFALIDVLKSLGAEVELDKHKLKIQAKHIKQETISLSKGARVRTSSLFIAPLLLRSKKAKIPNPQGCRLGARPIDRHIEGLEKMGAKVQYNSEDGYFYAQTDGLKGTRYRFEKNTHTGTETLIMAATLAQGTTILENAAEEHEIDDLIEMLNKMGAKIHREKNRKITIEGVKKLHGTTHSIVSDSNELITFAVLSAISTGSLVLKNADLKLIENFLDQFKNAGGSWEKSSDGLVFSISDSINPTNITTAPEPGFKTDWQGPWAILMTQANGTSTIHETIYESRFGYVSELNKMGAKISFFQPEVSNPQSTYNFNYEPNHDYNQAIKIQGPSKLHNAVLNITDLRAGATLVLASLIAKGETVVYGVEHIERGYENFHKRLQDIGADIKVEEE